MNKIIGIVVVLLISSDAFSSEVVFCNSCFTKAEFETYAKGHHGNVYGEKSYQVINYVTEEIWDVNVQGWNEDFDGSSYYGSNGFFMSVAWGVPASLQDVNDFKVIKDFLKADSLIFLPPDFEGGCNGLINSDTFLAYIILETEVKNVKKTKIIIHN